MTTDNNTTPSRASQKQPRPPFKQDLLRRIKDTKLTRWIRFGFVAALFIGWVIWMRSPWLAIFLFLLFDIYITGFIPFTWWKKHPSKAVRAVMSWVDAIVYALILVYFVFAFIGQNYQIPSQSLEKTLLTGDYLWVNKITYGPRVPMTPINFPMVHNTLPLLGCKSYLDSPSLPYKRLKGLRNVETGDIVVFNFPAGDTVSTLLEETPDYYDLLVKKYGWKRVNTDKATFGDIIYRPVDRRQNFVKRAVGLPGQRLSIIEDTIYIDGVAQPMPENVQFNYLAAFKAPLTDDILHEYGITPSDVYAFTHPMEIAALQTWMPQAGSKSLFYQLPMTDEMIAKFTSSGLMTGHIKARLAGGEPNAFLFPEGLAENWTLANYGGENGILIPRKGLTVELTPENWLTYRRVIRNYENHPDAYEKDGKVFIDGKEAKHYTFAMDYYFMMGDNRDFSQDSRFWGFVPEDHIVGTPVFVLISFDKDRSIFNGGIRWNRIFKNANPDKKKYQ